MGRGGGGGELQNGRGGQVKFYPYENGGGGSFGGVFLQNLEVLAILKRVRKKFPPFKK